MVPRAPASLVTAAAAAEVKIFPDTLPPSKVRGRPPLVPVRQVTTKPQVVDLLSEWATANQRRAVQQLDLAQANQRRAIRHLDRATANQHRAAHQLGRAAANQRTEAAHHPEPAPAPINKKTWPATALKTLLVAASVATEESRQVRVEMSEPLELWAPAPGA